MFLFLSRVPFVVSPLLFVLFTIICIIAAKKRRSYNAEPAARQQSSSSASRSDHNPLRVQPSGVQSVITQPTQYIPYRCPSVPPQPRPNPRLFWGDSGEQPVPRHRGSEPQGAPRAPAPQPTSPAPLADDWVRCLLRSTVELSTVKQYGSAPANQPVLRPQQRQSLQGTLPTNPLRSAHNLADQTVLRPHAKSKKNAKSKKK